MVNEEQLNILLQGVDVWNTWRNMNTGTILELDGGDFNKAYLREVDLHGANLSNVNLAGTYLREANLSGANLRDANLRDANLGKANLRGTCLIGANLREANLFDVRLSGADLSEADLSEANLRDAYLSKANLRKAKLNDANLRDAYLSEANLSGANLSGANLTDAKLGKANLSGTYLREANLNNAHFDEADLRGADLSEADLRGANLSGADLRMTDLSEADLSDANLQFATLISVDFDRANVTNCLVYGISAWDIKIENAIQSNLIITRNHESTITVDNLEVAQFIYLLLNNQKIRDVINTITSKVVLVLGRFSVEQKPVLDAIREKLRNHNYCPIMFDFDKPESRSTLETLTMLARMARFVIADLTDPRSIPMELGAIVPDLPSVPIQPILRNGKKPWGMYDHITKYSSVLKTHIYNGSDDLLATLEDKVIIPAEAKAKELGG